ncbi:MAG: hypothetical protein P8I62_03645, partial [Pseudomonadales bacterium]|nr:hypothetical protein [Pseudomonadales bacterium]
MRNNNSEYKRRQDDVPNTGERGQERRGERRVKRRSQQRDESRSEQRGEPRPDTMTLPNVRFPIELKVSAYFLLPLLFGMIVLAYIMIDAHRNFQQKQMDQFARVITAQLAASAVEPLFADAKMELAVLIN